MPLLAFLLCLLYVAHDLQKLEHKPRKATEYGLSEIEDIIWEVDEDANGWIDWENFVQLYLRCRKDRTVMLFLG